MKESFESPKVEIILFNEADIITASGDPTPPVHGENETPWG